MASIPETSFVFGGSRIVDLGYADLNGWTIFEVCGWRATRYVDVLDILINSHIRMTDPAVMARQLDVLKAGVLGTHLSAILIDLRGK